MDDKTYEALFQALLEAVRVLTRRVDKIEAAVTARQRRTDAERYSGLTSRLH